MQMSPILILGALLLASCGGGAAAPGLFVLFLTVAALAGCSKDKGTWEACYVDGGLTTCYCPPNTACNFGQGLPRDGGDATADAPMDAPVRVDARDAADVRDASPEGGAWAQCCVSGRTSTCFCPPGAACNFGLGETHCADGTCFFGQPDSGMCRVDGGADVRAER